MPYHHRQGVMGMQGTGLDVGPCRCPLAVKANAMQLAMARKRAQGVQFRQVCKGDGKTQSKRKRECSCNMVYAVETSEEDDGKMPFSDLRGIKDDLIHYIKIIPRQSNS